LNADQNGLLFNQVKAMVFRREGFPGRNPDIGSILRKMAKCPGAAGKIVGPFHADLEIHYSPFAFLGFFQVFVEYFRAREKKSKSMKPGGFEDHAPPAPADKNSLLKIFILAMLKMMIS
jgi:hypothetical protein